MKSKLLSFVLVLCLLFSGFTIGLPAYSAKATVPTNSKVIFSEGDCAITADGTLWAWGNNECGELLDGATINRTYAVKIMTNVAEARKAYDYFHVLKKDGTLWGWGNNQNGFVGSGKKNIQKTPVKILSNVKSYDGIYAIKNDGTLWTWGSGNLGDGSEKTRYSPVKIADNVISVHDSGVTMMIKKDGSLWGWGDNYWGALGNGKKGGKVLKPVKILGNIISVSVNTHGCGAIDKNGDVWSWGQFAVGNGSLSSLTPVKVLDNAEKIISADSYKLVLRKDSSLWGWGNNGNGQLGLSSPLEKTVLIPEKIMDSVKDFYLDGTASFAIKNDNALWAWGNVDCLDSGYYEYGVQPAKFMTNVSEVYAGNDKTYALKRDKTLWVWGASYNDKTYRGYPFKPRKLIDNISYFTPGSPPRAIKGDGTLWGWSPYYLSENGKALYPKMVRYMNDASSVKLNQSSLSLLTDKNATLKAMVSPADATDKTITWFSSNKAVATVSSKGVVKAKQAGTATITAKTVNGKKFNCKIFVSSYVTLRVGQTRAIQNSKKTTIDSVGTKPYISGGRTMLPLRFVGERMGGKVTYVNDQKPITLTYGKTKVQITLGSKSMKVIVPSKTTTVNLDVAVQKKNGKTYIPIRAISQALGFQVYYQSSTKLIIISNPKMSNALCMARLSEGKKYIIR